MTTFTYFEPMSAGHCAFWARMILKAAAGDLRITQLRLVTGQDMAKRLSSVIAATGLDLIVITDGELARLRTGRLLSQGWAQWATARTLLKDTGGALFLPFFDHAAYGAMLDRRSVNGTISGIIFRPPNNFGYPSTIKRRLDALRRWTTYAAASRSSLKTLFTLDECAAEASRTGLRHLVFLPDPAPDAMLLQDAIVTPRIDGRRWFLLFGALAERKGIFRVLEAIDRLSEIEAVAIGLRFVGKLDRQDSSAFLQRLDDLRKRRPTLAIELEDRFLSDQELAAEVVSCDAILAPYQDHIGSSGAVLWAAAVGKPVVSQKTGAMGYQVVTHGLGLAIDSTNVAEIAAALVSNPPLSRVPDTFIATHTTNNFCQVILDRCLA